MLLSGRYILLALMTILAPTISMSAPPRGKNRCKPGFLGSNFSEFLLFNNSGWFLRYFQHISWNTLPIMVPKRIIFSSPLERIQISYSFFIKI